MKSIVLEHSSFIIVLWNLLPLAGLLLLRREYVAPALHILSESHKLYDSGISDR